MKRILLVAFTLAACAQGGPNTRTQEQDTEVDLEPPEMSHEYDRSPRTFGEPVYIQAVLTDESRIEDVFLVFQPATSDQQWTSLRMAFLANDLFEGVIPGTAVTSSGMRYYIRSSDEWGNEACLPDGCAVEAWYFPVVRGR